MMISATAPMFTTFYARIFLKESIAVADILNLILVFVGIVFIVKPPFMFGHSQIYQEDPEALQAILLLVFGAIFLQATVYVILRMLKGIFLNANRPHL